jgi:Gluconate 2-dehydrogenase subunit 3
MVTRRFAIRQMLVASAGILLVPSCMEDRTKASFLLKNFSITAEQEKLLAEIAETIIPKTSTPGAKDVYAHQFAMKMMDDCASKEDQQKFVKGLGAFASFAEKKTGTDFLKATPAQRASVLEDLEQRKGDESDELAFYKKMKALTIRGYSSSQYFLTEVQVYNIIPGPFKGCVPIQKA